MFFLLFLLSCCNIRSIVILWSRLPKVLHLHLKPLHLIAFPRNSSLESYNKFPGRNFKFLMASILSKLASVEEQRELFTWRFSDVDKKEVDDLFKVHF